MIVITIIIIIVGRRRRRTWSSVCVMDWGGWREGRGGEKGVQREWTSSDREQAQTRGRTRDTLNSCFPVFFIILFLLILFILRFSFAEKCDWAFFFVSLNFHRLRLSIIFISLDYKADDVMFSSIFLWFLYSCFFFLSFFLCRYVQKRLGGTWVRERRWYELFSLFVFFLLSLSWNAFVYFCILRTISRANYYLVMEPVIQGGIERKSRISWVT